MADPLVDQLRAELEKIELPPGLDLDVLTSKTVMDRILPLMTVFAKTQIQGQQDVKDLTGEKLRTLAEKIIIAPTGTEDISRFVNDVANGIMSAEWIDNAITELSKHWLWGPIMAVIVGGVHVGTTIFNYASVSAERTRQIANESIRPYMLDLATLVSEYHRHPNNYAFVLEQLRKTGISDQKIEVFLDNARTFPDLGILTRLWHRGEITDTTFNSMLKALKYSDDDIALIKPALFQYPGVSDLVTMAVREVFDPELAESLGLFGDMPQEFLDEAEKAGLPVKYARMFWGAHWTPPAIGQAFEMFHRGLIEEDELMDLIRINDYMPNYRGKLKDIAYKLPTRIDTRRVYDDGFISYDELYEITLGQGYSPEHAQMMTDWVDNRYGEARKEIAKGEVLKLYKLGYYSESDALDALATMGYSEAARFELIVKVDMEKAEKEKKDLLKLMKKAFVTEELDENIITGRLTGAGLSRIEIELLFADWTIEVKTIIKLLSKEDIEKLFMADLWDNDQARAYLQRVGYNINDTDSLIMLWEHGKGGE